MATRTRPDALPNVVACIADELRGSAGGPATSITVGGSEFQLPPGLVALMVDLLDDVAEGRVR